MVKDIGLIILGIAVCSLVFLLYMFYSFNLQKAYRYRQVVQNPQGALSNQPADGKRSNHCRSSDLSICYFSKERITFLYLKGFPPCYFFGEINRGT